MVHFNENQHPRHFLHLAILFGGTSVICILFYVFRHIPSYQVITALTGSIFYSAWGIIHHAIEGRLTSIIAIEYILLSLLAFVVIFTALFI